MRLEIVMVDGMGGGWGEVEARALVIYEIKSSLHKTMPALREAGKF